MPVVLLQRHVTALHESGHAVAAVAQGLYVTSATIVPDGELSGRVTWHRSSRDAVHEHLVTAMAGPIAAHHALGSPCSFQSYPQDLTVIRALIGTDDEIRSPVFQRALVAAWDFVRRHERSIDRVARLLLTRHTLRHRDVAQAL